MSARPMHATPRVTGATLRAFAAVLGIASLDAPAHAEEFRRLNGGQILAQVIGRDITDDYHWTEYYRRDGVLLTDDMGHRKIGRWRIERDMLCTVSDRGEPQRCWQVWISGSAVSLRAEAQDRTPPAFVRTHQAR